MTVDHWRSEPGTWFVRILARGPVLFYFRKFYNLRYHMSHFIKPTYVSFIKWCKKDV